MVIFLQQLRVEMSEIQEQNKFKKHLSQYWASKGITQIKIPQIGGKQLNLFKLYKSVCRKGGGQAVSHNKMWKEIVDEFGLPSTCTSASFTLKNHYQKYLLGYEQRYYFGKEDSADLPELVAGRTRKPILGVRDEGMPITINFLNKYGDRAMDTSSLTTELNKYYEKSEPNQQINYIKRTKMYPSMPEVKRMILGFQSSLVEEINFSINTLLLYSVNTEAPFLFMQYPYVIEAITQFIKSLYPPKNIQQYELVRSITLALRNLTIDYRNLQPVQESAELMDILTQIMEEKLDRQTNRNLVDIFSSLTNVGWDCMKLIDQIESFLDRDTSQDLETGIDLLKSLVEEKEQICDELIVKKMDFFVRLLIHQQYYIRQAVLQIFAYITDKSEMVREACLTSFSFMNRIFAILSHSTGSSEKQAQLAGYILNNLSKKDENMEILKKFQKQIVMISFNDHSLSSITSSLLYRFSHDDIKEKDGQIMKEDPHL